MPFDLIDPLIKKHVNRSIDDQRFINDVIINHTIKGFSFYNIFSRFSHQKVLLTDNEFGEMDMMG